MKALLEKILDKVLFHSETVIAIPVAIAALLAISMVVKWATGGDLTEDIGTVVSYSIKAVGFLIAAGIGIAIKSRGFGDVDEKTCSTGKLLVDSISLWIVLLLAVLCLFGATLWL